jgi:hypothetical protein
MKSEMAKATLDFSYDMHGGNYFRIIDEVDFYEPAFFEPFLCPISQKDALVRRLLQTNNDNRQALQMFTDALGKMADIMILRVESRSNAASSNTTSSNAASNKQQATSNKQQCNKQQCSKQQYTS